MTLDDLKAEWMGSARFRSAYSNARRRVALGMHLEAIREAAWPYVIALAGAVLIHYKRPQAPADFRDLVGVSVNIAGVGIAFIAAIQGVMLSISESRIIVQLKQLGSYRTLLRYFDEAIVSCALVIAVSFVGYYIDLKDAGTREARWYYVVWFYFCLQAGLTTLRITKFFSRILRMHAGE